MRLSSISSNLTRGGDGTRLNGAHTRGIHTHTHTHTTPLNATPSRPRYSSPAPMKPVARPSFSSSVGRAVTTCPNHCRAPYSTHVTYARAARGVRTARQCSVLASDLGLQPVEVEVFRVFEHEVLVDLVRVRVSVRVRVRVRVRARVRVRVRDRVKVWARLRVMECVLTLKVSTMSGIERVYIIFRCAGTW